MMRDSSFFCFSNLARSDVESTIYLTSIDGDDLTPDEFCYFEGESGFTTSGWSVDKDDA